tara:strand:- start:432 stop:668 length:237 start_codon:yes stop_codon:yes gene_type:complete
MMGHKERLVKYFTQEKPRITSLEATYDLGNTRLAATIFNLRDEGFNIESTQKRVPTRWGNEVVVTEYIFHGKNTSSAS